MLLPSYQTVQVLVISTLTGVFTTISSLVPATIRELFHHEEVCLCPPASPANDRPHGNAGLIRDCTLEGSEGVCVRFLSLTTTRWSVHW